MKYLNIRTIAIVILVLSTNVFFVSESATAQDKDGTYTNSIGMKFVLIPAGTFKMGLEKSLNELDANAVPLHQVKIGKPFYLGVYEVTQQQWKDVMGDNPSYYQGDDNPVETVSWEDVQEFIKRLNQKEGHSRYRLPTEAEWEYAARAGSTSTYYFGEEMSQLDDYAWYYDNSENTSHPVGQKRPNAWGLHDILGNVGEWTGDWYEESYYAKSPSDDPTGPSSGSSRTGRGCSTCDEARLCQSAARGSAMPDYGDEYIGFRLALTPEGSE
jgi:formylglycine-generating enzyme required for sulfatase activity